MSSQSYLDSLNDRYSDLTTTGNSIAAEIGRSLTQEEAESIGINKSEYLALQQVNSDSSSATDHTSSSNRKGTSTSSEGSLGLSTIAGGAMTRVGSSNDKVQDQGKLVNQQLSYNEALSKIKSATKDGRLSHTSNDVHSLSDKLNSNFSKQQSIGQEIAITEHTMKQLSHSINYVSQNPAVIDRNLNEPVIKCNSYKKYFWSQ